MFQAIEIDGERYWDGGYSGNPTITPLIRECKSQDTILVQINPVEREKAPRTASEILNRLNEVSFNAVLLKELRMIAVLRQVADPGNSEGAQWAGMRIHRIASDMLTEFGASSKLNAEWDFFSLLHDEGRRSAQLFLETHASRTIALGTSTFTMSALPGTPAIQNAIPKPFFGTTSFAAPGFGIVASLVMLAFGLWWLGHAETLGRKARVTGPMPTSLSMPQRTSWFASAQRRPAHSIRRRFSTAIKPIPLRLPP
jgi:hypothetical protein